MLILSALSLSLVSSDVVLSVNKRQADRFTIPESCHSDCAVLGEVTIRIANGDFASTCSDTVSSQISICLACAVNANPSAFTADVHDNIQADIVEYIAACSAVGATVTPPKLQAPTGNKSRSSGAGSSTDSATTTPKDTLTRAVTTGTNSHSGASSSAASASSTGAAVNLKAPIGLAAAIASAFTFLI